MRLKNLAESIAAFARNAKRNQSLRLHVAIQEWEEGQHLKTVYYDGQYDFIWPDTGI